MTTVLTLLVGVALVGAIEGGLFAVRYFTDRRTIELQRRLQVMAKGTGEERDLLRRTRYARSRSLDTVLRSLTPARRLLSLLESADSQMTVAQVLTYSLGLAALAFLALCVVGRSALAPVGALAAGALPTLFLRSARARRSRRLSEQLPEALEMMSRSLRAGHALSSAFEVVATEMPEPIAVEFARAFDEQRLGLSFDEAVRRMAARAASNGDMKIFAISAVVQRETGGNLAEILDKIAHTVRERYKFFGKVRALTAEGRASAIVVGGLPFVVAFALVLLNPGYIVRLVDNPLGRLVLALAAVFWFVGEALMIRLARVEF